MLINMWHNYSRGKNVIMTSSILAFSDDATTQKHVFKVAFFRICLMLLTNTSYKLLKISFLSFYRWYHLLFKSLHYLVNLILLRNVLQKNFNFFI